MRIAVLSDIHSNLVALDAVLADAGAVDAVWHLGDVVGYGPDPDGVVGRLATIDAVGVLGNHDAAALGGPEIDWFNPEARAAAEWTRDTMSDDTRRWITGLPETRIVDDILLVHGSPRDPLREYVTDGEAAEENMAIQRTQRALHGHTHVPVAWFATPDHVTLVQARDTSTVELGEHRSLINPGSVLAAPAAAPPDGLRIGPLLVNGTSGVLVFVPQ